MLFLSASPFGIPHVSVMHTIFLQIRNLRYSSAISLLSNLLEANGNSRAALSLLAYSYFYSQDFINAANCYEQLTILHPGDEDYKIYYAQSLYQACLYDEAMKVTSQIDRLEWIGKVTKLKAAIKYGEEDLMAAKKLVENCPPNDIDTEINRACILYKEERYEEALKMFTAAQQVVPYCPHLSYNAALCHYRLREYNQALSQIATITEYGIREHPEMSVGMSTEGIDVRSVGNTVALHETALIEAFNLKAAIYYQKKNFEEAKDALTDMPPRSEEELDAVTLHNQALINVDTNPSECFEKLQFLLHQNPFPPETFGNVLLLYCKYELYDLAADVLAENAHLTHKYLTPVSKQYASYMNSIFRCKKTPQGRMDLKKV
ncbi:hypothetical protein J437_LFUL003946 [Ladona fulva]|uniref:Tetratricopeptide repeat protein 30 n=1 Tax=Ladona fulva TaxID=123851 RepID=A0A8K0P3H7_LADFU|nr:hypothetical protein J437_LFUL003946 [Ladona fulva]